MKVRVVRVVSITHRHGTDISVCRTEDGARAVLVEWARTWWADEMSGTAEPTDDQKAVDLYFESVSDEYYDIAEAVVRP